MAKLPKIPRGLKSSISRMERKVAQQEKRKKRIAEIEQMKKKRETLRKKLYG